MTAHPFHLAAANLSVTYLFLFLSVALGVVAVLLFKPTDRQKIKLLISFAGAYVLAITVLHLLPEAYGTHPGESAGKHADEANHMHTVGLLILAGFFIQLLLEYFSHGIEHGHAHHDHSGAIPWGMMFGLCVHAFIEGMPLGVESHHSEHQHSQNMLLTGIIMHNIPVSVVLFTMLIHNGVRQGKALGLMLVFGLMSPLGTLSSRVVDFSKYSHALMAVVIGIFLHISTTILFESSEEHRFNRRKLIAIGIGAAVALATSSM